MNIRYEWYEDKRRETLDNRELDFADIETLFEWDTVIIIPSDQNDELRWVLMVISAPACTSSCTLDEVRWVKSGA